MANPSVTDIELENFRSGYPRYAKLLSLDPAFQNFRRFTRVRMRLLLSKQDEISALEQELDTIDENETKELFLGCRRRDGNNERIRKLQQLDQCVAEYDALLDRCFSVLSRPDANRRDIANLRTWVKGTRSIARQETAYLEHENEMINLAGANASIIGQVEHMIEDCVFQLETALHRLGIRPPSKSRWVRNDSVEVFVAGPYIKRFSRILTTWIATIVVVAPVIVLDNVSNYIARLILIVVSGAIFLSCVSLFTNARTVELFAAGASYTAVLVIFTSAGQQTISDNQ